jgi:hypothetical protein
MKEGRVAHSLFVLLVAVAKAITDVKCWVQIPLGLNQPCISARVNQILCIVLITKGQSTGLQLCGMTCFNHYLLSKPDVYCVEY